MNIVSKRIVRITVPSEPSPTTLVKRLLIAPRVNGYDSLVPQMNDQH
jgi:hypothetical protein